MSKNTLLKTFPTYKIDTEANNQPHLIVKNVVFLYFVAVDSGRNVDLLKSFLFIHFVSNKCDS